MKTQIVRGGKECLSSQSGFCLVQEEGGGAPQVLGGKIKYK